MYLIYSFLNTIVENLQWFGNVTYYLLLVLAMFPDRSNASGMALAPPPMPPSGLMAQLQGGNNGGGNSSGPTWVSLSTLFNHVALKELFKSNSKNRSI